MSGQLPDLVLTLFGIVAGFGALLAAIIALPKALRIVGHTIRAIFRWFVAAVRAVAVVSDLPVTLAKLSANDDDKLKAIAAVKTELLAADAEKLRLITQVRDTLDSHIEETRLGREEWDAMKGTLHTLVTTADAIKHEVKNNGGSSMKDTTDRIEAGVKGLYARPGESGTAGREHEHA